MSNTSMARSVPDLDVDHTRDRTSEQKSIYHPLNEAEREVRFIRLLRRNNNCIECEIAKFSLNGQSHYKALSYCWTKSEPIRAILLNERLINIRPNLYGFLEQMLEDGQVGWFFVDAVCINQDDLDERSQQVRLMRDIYSGAREVIAWLGNTGPVPRNEIRNLLLAEGSWIPVTIERSQENMDSWRAILHGLLPWEYWSRAWIVQEIIVAPVLVFRWKNTTSPSYQILRLFRKLMEQMGRDPGQVEASSWRYGGNVTLAARTSGSQILGWTLPTGLIVMSKRESLQSQHQARLNLTHAVCTFSFHECTDPYDKVFAILGLTRSRLIADYRMPKMELFLRLFIEGMLEEGSILESSAHNAQAARVNVHLFITFQVALLMACGLCPNHRTVALVTMRAYIKVYKDCPSPLYMYTEMLYMYGAISSGNMAGFSNTVRLRIARAQAWIHSIRLRWATYKMKDSSLLRPCDQTGRKTYGAWAEAIEVILTELRGQTGMEDLEATSLATDMRYWKMKGPSSHRGMKYWSVVVALVLALFSTCLYHSRNSARD